MEKKWRWLRYVAQFQLIITCSVQSVSLDVTHAAVYQMMVVVIVFIDDLCTNN